MASVAPPSREVLQQLDDEAWREYAEACLSLASEEQKREAFERAMASLEMLLDHDTRLPHPLSAR